MKSIEEKLALTIAALERIISVTEPKTISDMKGYRMVSNLRTIAEQTLKDIATID